MSSSVAPPVPQQQQGGGGSSSSGSHHASSTSTSESDTDSSDDEWKSVPFSFLLTNQLIADVQQQRKLKPPERSPSHTHPAPTKLELSGEFKFVEYIPEWTHPDWDDDYITVVGEKEPRGKIFNNDFSRKLRAALLPKDSLRNPTPYARRWGMHPDRTDGRSRLSPTGSSTRRVGLSQPMRTADNQLRLFLSGQDLPADLEARASDLGMSAADYLDSAAVSSQTDPQTLSPLRELFGMNEGDKDFQRLLFLDMTTDEKLAHGIHTVEELEVQYDLAGPLHHLVERKRWVSTVDRGTTEDEPRYLYNLFGRRGEYGADDDLVWMAMQPALQLVTRVLNSNHPFWMAILNMMNRKPVNPSRYPLHGHTNLSLVSIWEQLKNPHLHNEAKVLEDAGYDHCRAVALFLKDRLELGFASSYRKTPGMPTNFWGVTHGNNQNDPSMVTIQIEIAAEMIWPLLVPSYTQAEKGSVSLMLASTLLHELAHAVNMAIRALTRAPEKDHRYIEQLQGWDKPVLMSLDKIGKVLARDPRAEPYWEDEPRQEMGFAFENQIWGGLLNIPVETAARMNDRFEFLAFDVGLDAWPCARPNPHEPEKTILTQPPLPVDTLMTPLPVKAWTKLYSQQFWDCDYKKYGHHALKLVPDRPVPALLGRNYKRLRDLKRIFGDGEGHWLHIALGKLSAAGKTTLYIYLRELVNDRLEHVWIRKRFHHECKVWSHRNDKLDELLDRSQELSDQLASNFQALNVEVLKKDRFITQHNLAAVGAAVAAEDSDEDDNLRLLGIEAFTQTLLQEAEESFDELIGSYENLHHHLLIELQHTQCLVVDYIQQEPNDRKVLYDRYGYYLHELIEQCFEHALDQAIQHLGDLKQLFNDVGGLTPRVRADIDRVRTTLQVDRNNFVECKVYLTSDYIDRVEGGWRGKFATVPSGRYKRRSKFMEKLAIKEMLQSEEAVKGVVEMIGTILDRHKDVFKAVSKPQEENLAATMEAQLQASRDRRTRAAGAPGWKGLAEILRGPDFTGMRAATPVYPNPREPALMNVDVPPWTPAQSTGPSRTSTPYFAGPNVSFGVANLPDPTPPVTPPPGTASAPAFTQYASSSNLFPAQQQGPSIFATSQPLAPATSGAAQVGIGGAAVAQGWRPFGDAYSVTATLSDDLRAAAIRPAEIQRVFGADAFVMEEARVREEARAREEAAAQAAARAAAQAAAFAQGQGQRQGEWQWQFREREQEQEQEQEQE